MASPALKYAPQESSNVSGITEIHITQSQGGAVSREVLLPMLAHLSKQGKDRWFTWIAPKGISKSLLLRYGFDLNKVQLVHTDSSTDIRWLIWEALNNGNSETVVVEASSLSKLSAADVSEFEAASIKGACRGLLLRG